jgi:phosphate:Na+ symporter
MLILNILGGIALILFGIRFLRKGLNRLFGQRLQESLKRATQHRVKAFCTGVVVAGLAPSSTGIATMVVQMMNAANLPARQMLSIVLGANVGITAAVQLVSLQLSGYFAILLVPGVILFQFLQRNTPRGIGQCLLAIGIIFLGMGTIGQTAAKIDPSGDLVQMLLILSNHPLLLILITAVLTLLVQSTTAVIGLVVGMAAGLSIAGSDPRFLLQMAVPMVVGADVGIACTNLVAGWGSLEGRRLGLANLLLKSLVALICFLALSPLISLVQASPGDLTRQIANLHTSFNIVVALIGLPLIIPVCRLTAKIIEDPKPTHDGSIQALRPSSFLDRQALSTPWIAVVNASRETLRLADSVKAMLEGFHQANLNKDKPLMQQVQRMDDEVDNIYLSLKRYLSEIEVEDLSNRDRNLHFALLGFSNELESIGDIIDKHLCDACLKKPAVCELGSKDRANLGDAWNRVMERVDLAITLLATQNRNLAEKLTSGKSSFNTWCREARAAHFQRLVQSSPTLPESSGYYLEILGGYRRISSHLNQLATLS